MAGRNSLASNQMTNSSSFEKKGIAAPTLFNFKPQQEISSANKNWQKEIAALPEIPKRKTNTTTTQLPELAATQLNLYAQNTVAEAKEFFKNQYRNHYDDSVLQTHRFFTPKSKTRLFGATVELINDKIERLHPDQQPEGKQLTIKELRRTKDDIGYRSALEIAMDTIADTLELNSTSPTNRI